MKALVTLLVLAAAAAAVWILFLGGPDFGQDASNPLGTFAEIQAYLLEHELEPGDEVAPEALARYFGEEFGERDDLVARQYLDRVPGYPHFVVIVRDSAGKVVAVRSQFRSGLKEFSTQGSRSAVFAAKHWLAVTGKEPAWAEKRFGSGDGQVYLEADAAAAGVRGSWRKEGPGGLGLNYQIVDQVVLVAR